MRNLCPCGSKKIYTACCAPFIAGVALPDTPEQLMRSRYTAYATGDLTYIEHTMLPPALFNFDSKEAREWAKQVKWLKLNVIEASQENDKGIVEFVAEYRYQQRKHVLHERSEFRRENGKWFYIDGNIFS